MASNDGQVILGSVRHSTSLSHYRQGTTSTSLGSSTWSKDESSDRRNGPSSASAAAAVLDKPRVEVAAGEKPLEHLSGYVLRGDCVDHLEHPPESTDGDSANCGRATYWLINMKCTDGALASFSFVVGVAAILLQVMSLGSDHWLYTIEPRSVGNITEKTNGESKDFLFQFNSGYWRICRERFCQSGDNLTSLEIYFFTTEPEYQRMCLSWSRPPNGTEDHQGFSKASGAILNRILLSAVLHIVSLGITGLGLGLAIPGHIRRDKRTFVAAILYIMSGICMSIAVMQYICVVDDEMAPKMKQTPEGESSKYKFDYGWSYVAASMSFMCIETCALVELLLFLRRFPSLEDKMSLVPGLKDKIRRAVLHHEFDETLPTRQCTRTSPRISFSYHPDEAGGGDGDEDATSDSV